MVSKQGYTHTNDVHSSSNGLRRDFFPADNMNGQLSLELSCFALCNLAFLSGPNNRVH